MPAVSLDASPARPRRRTPAAVPRPVPAVHVRTGGTVRVAILDLNDGHPNQGMRCLRELLEAHDGAFGGASILWDEFDVRRRAEVPDLRYDVYLSSGGPGSPFDGEGSAWEAKYFAWVDALLAHNDGAGATPKAAFFICHSFELLVRHLGLATLEPRRSESFGIFPVHKTDAGAADPLLAGLPEPFYGADFRSWQAVQPDAPALAALGAEVLAIEKDRPHVGLERAVMALRLSPDVVATQFHPEADPDGMLLHFRQEHRREEIVAKHGAEKYARILHEMVAPGYLPATHAHLLPTFLRAAADRLRTGAAAGPLTSA